MKSIYFYNGDKESLIGVAMTDKEAWEVYSNFIKKELHYTPYYYRISTHEDVTVIDYGSHCNFIHIREGD